MSDLKKIIIALAVIVLLLGLHYLNWLKPAENVLVRVLTPIQAKARDFSSGIKDFSNNWLNKRNLLLENNDLKEKLKTSRVDQAKLNSLSAENELLKKELKFLEERPVKYVAAKIVTGISDPLSQSVIINRGRKDGITKGLAVVADKGILVGKVYEVRDNFSKVLLLTDSQSKVAATIQNLDLTIGLVEGQFGLSFAMTNIPQNQAVAEGDLIVTSGLEGNIPKDLLIAQVESVNQVESEIFKTAILKPVIPFNNLSYVLVIIP